MALVLRVFSGVDKLERLLLTAAVMNFTFLISKYNFWEMTAQGRLVGLCVCACVFVNGGLLPP